MYRSRDRLIIVDADGTVIDAFCAIGTAFARHGMNLGDLERFQKRRRPMGDRLRRRKRQHQCGLTRGKERSTEVSSSLPDFGIVGCETTATAHFSPASCPIVRLCGGESGKN